LLLPLRHLVELLRLHLEDVDKFVLGEVPLALKRAVAVGTYALGPLDLTHLALFQSQSVRQDLVVRSHETIKGIRTQGTLEQLIAQEVSQADK